MSKIANAFQNGAAFIGFVTGGDPSLAKSEEIILAMVRGGADLIEIGIPFSDPIAEGSVIQAANLRALAAGATVDGIFAMVRCLREKTQTPIVFLTYLNPVHHYGYEAFFARCEETGVDGIILPDLPFEEQEELRGITAVHGVDLISLIAPTSAQRIARIAAQARGFLYLVSSMGVTGVRSEITTDLSAMLALVREAARLPAAVGFGIHSLAQAKEIARIADGVIVGSAIVKLVAQYGDDAAEAVEDYVRRMKAAMTQNE
ncbi:MAG: tryptophan synthase subunit alpha [Oscillospiraceae bacterium]|jgi:tryptophan synthase alpha chain|nr:tryptophan synthase subunit alpha [Oscillospiraceae bacterium]